MSVLDLVVNLSLLPFVFAGTAPSNFETDTLATSRGDLKITFIGHGTLMFQFAGKVIHVDPVSRYADYARLPMDYNVVHVRGPGRPFHPKGVGNGYVITFGDKRIYIAGDTENIPEMAKLAKIDVALLPMNLPYTMTPKMVADAVRTIKPKIVYPYHFGNTDTSQLAKLLKDVEGVEIRIRKMK